MPTENHQSIKELVEKQSIVHQIPPFGGMNGGQNKKTFCPPYLATWLNGQTKPTPTSTYRVGKPAWRCQTGTTVEQALYEQIVANSQSPQR